MRIYWASRHKLAEKQLKMLNEFFNSPEVIHEKITFKNNEGLADYINDRNSPVVCVAGAVHYLYAMMKGLEFYIFERDNSMEFSALYRVKNHEVKKIAEGGGYTIEQHGMNHIYEGRK